MTLDLTTLKPGDTIKGEPDGRGLVSPKTLVISAVGRNSALAVDPVHNAECWITSNEFRQWSVVVPPPPCPITEPTTLTFDQIDGDGQPWWAARPDVPYIRTPGNPTATITLHPSPHDVPEHEQWGIYTWGDPT